MFNQATKISHSVKIIVSVNSILKSYRFTIVQYRQNIFSLYVTYVKPKVFESKSPALFSPSWKKKIYLTASFVYILYFILPYLSSTRFSHIPD